jgi:hypothetical protein
LPNSQRNAKKQKIVDLLKENSAPDSQQPTPSADTAPSPTSSPASNSGIVVLGSNNYVAGSNLSVNQSPAAAPPAAVPPAPAPTTSASTAAFLEHVEFQKAARVSCSVAERAQLEWLVNERSFVFDDLKKAMQRAGLRWSDKDGHLAPDGAVASIAMLSVVFLVLLAFLILFLVYWVPTHGRMDTVKFYGGTILSVCAFGGCYCFMWSRSVVPLKTAFKAAKTLKEKLAENR